MVIAVYNQRGGVGKTFFSSHLAMLLAFYKRKVCLMDMDGQGNSMKWVGGQNAEGAWNWDGEQKTMTARGVDLIWAGHPDFYEGNVFPEIPQGYEFTIIDCRPELDVLSSVIDLLDLVVIPVKGRFSYDSAADVKYVVDQLRGKNQVKVFILKNEMMPNRMIASREEQAYLEAINANIFPFGFLRDGKVRSAELGGVPIWQLNYGDRSAVMTTLRAVCQDILKADVPKVRVMRPRGERGPVGANAPKIGRAERVSAGKARAQ